MTTARQLIDRLVESYQPQHPTGADLNRVLNAVRGWLDQQGGKEPSRADAIKMLTLAGVTDPELYLSFFMRDWASLSQDSSFE